MGIMIVNSRRCSDEHTRTRLLNSLGYFQKTADKTAGRHSNQSSSSSSLSAASSLSTDLNKKNASSHQPFFGHHYALRRNPSMLGDATPSVMKLNDDNDGHNISSTDIDKTPPFSSTSPTSCTTDISASTNNNSNNNINNINNNEHNESQCSQMQQPPTDVTNAATTSPATPASPVVQFNEHVSVISIPSRYQYSNRIKKFLWSNKRELSEMAERNVIEFSAEGWDWNNVVMDEDMYVDSQTGNLIHPCHFQQDGQQHSFYDEDNEDNDHDYHEDSSFQPLERQPYVAA